MERSGMFPAPLQFLAAQSAHMNLKIKISAWLVLWSPSRPVLTRHVPRWWVDWTRHLSVGGLFGPASKNGPYSRLQRFRRAARAVLVSKLAMPVDHPVEFCKAWQCPVFSPNQMQLGNGGLCRVDPDGENWVYQGQRFQNEHLISKSQVDASALVFFIGQCVDLSLSNCLMFFVYASRTFTDHLLAETMLVSHHGSWFHAMLAWIDFSTTGMRKWLIYSPILLNIFCVCIQ